MSKKPTSFTGWQKKAKRNGWVTPVNSVFSNDTWIRYWTAMDNYETGVAEGRPIPPHRTGASEKFPMFI